MIDEFHKHEALDRACLVAEMFDKYLLNHPAVQADVDLLNRCESISCELWMLYQDCGQ